MTRIEVATPPDSPTKVKGDLLENIAADLLKAQNYKVVEEVRVTASELDLLCQHKVNSKQIYVECKAHRSPLSANILTNLLGTVNFKKYHEGWLISTGPLGKDAKGFKHEWEAKPSDESQLLSIYTPDRVLSAFIDVRLIKDPPYTKASEIIQDEDLIGDWVFLITPYGKHWVLTILSGGVPEGVLIFSAKTGTLCKDRKLLRNLAECDTSFNELNFEYIFHLDNLLTGATIVRTVIEVQSGENWSDYRPARPDDFVGRYDEQKQVIQFFENISNQETSTRIFAITGDSGMGKSSLIAKLRARTRNIRYRRKFFVFAVDVRAAIDASYLLSSLLTGLRQAAENGFGDEDPNQIKITNPSAPLESESIQNFLDSVSQKNQVICIIFDQFEELYSKTELFSVFEVAQKLLISTTSTQSSLALGFAWKTDSTVQQNHPAYYLWHRLADHRMEVRLRRFTHSEASSAITIFEKQLTSKLRSDIRRQLIESSQGYPWLLKKLSIHIYDQLKDGISQTEIMNKTLDVESLFKRDLQQLTPAEDACLKIIAHTAPSDWYEILEASDQETLRGLQQKRLIVRSGNRLNLYWDIFREFVLTGTVPSIPLTYLPTSPSLRTMLAVAQLLDPISNQSYADLGKNVGISEKSVGNIVRDLIMFGVATGRQSQVKLVQEMPSADPKDILRKIRQVLKYHALTINIYQLEIGDYLSIEDVINLLKNINPAAQHQQRTWKLYADRMGEWLSATGYLFPEENGWRIEDRGEDSISPTNAFVRRYYTRHPSKYKENTLFIGDTSPYKAVQTLKWLSAQPPLKWAEITSAGHRNGARTLLNLRLIRNEHGKYVIAQAVRNESQELKEIVWEAARKEPVMELVIQFIRTTPKATSEQIGELVGKNYERDWTPASIHRIGNSLKQWATWLVFGIDNKIVSEPPGRKDKSNAEDNQLRLFP